MTAVIARTNAAGAATMSSAPEIRPSIRTPAAAAMSRTAPKSRQLGVRKAQCQWPRAKRIASRTSARRSQVSSIAAMRVTARPKNEPTTIQATQLQSRTMAISPQRPAANAPGEEVRDRGDGPQEGHRELLAEAAEERGATGGDDHEDERDQEQEAVERQEDLALVPSRAARVAQHLEDVDRLCHSPSAIGSACAPGIR